MGKRQRRWPTTVGVWAGGATLAIFGPICQCPLGKQSTRGEWDHRGWLGGESNTHCRLHKFHQKMEGGGGFYRLHVADDCLMDREAR